MKAGETLLVLGAAGGVGTSAIQVGKALGARVIAAASSDEKCELCRSIGADATINYSREKLRDAIQAATGGKGPDVIYDPVGGDLAEPALRSIAWRGRYLIIGFASGNIPSLPLNLPLLKGASLVGVFWGSFAKHEPRANAALLAELVRWYGEGRIKPVIDRAMPMAELKAAFEYMGSRAVKGKLVMVNLKTRPAAIIAVSPVAVAQLVESRIVIPVVVGSSPISHPIRTCRPPLHFLVARQQAARAKTATLEVAFLLGTIGTDAGNGWAACRAGQIRITPGCVPS